MVTSLTEIVAANRKQAGMARTVGGPAGVTPLGDRPGTSSESNVTSWKGTAAGRARAFTLAAFLIFTFVHLAAEARYGE